MSNLQEGLTLLEQVCGNNKDNAISLATISLNTDINGFSIPYVRDVSSYYSNGYFYVTTHALSNKIIQIKENHNVAFGVHFEGLSGNGIAENLGCVLEPKNSELRSKLREVFEPWYDHANNEQDQNYVILAIKVTRLRVFRDEGKTDKEFK